MKAPDADFVLFQQFQQFKAMIATKTSTPGSGTSSPMKIESRDSSPIQSRPAKVAKIGEGLSIDHQLPALPLYEPPSSTAFDIRHYANLISLESRGCVLLVDQSAQEVMITLGCPWWCQIEASLDINGAHAIFVNIVPDDNGLFGVLSQVDPILITEQTWKMKATRSGLSVPLAPYSFTIPIPAKVFNRRAIKISDVQLEISRIVRVRLPFLA